MQPICAQYGDAVSAGLVSVVPTFRPSQNLLALVEQLRRHGPVIVSDDSSPCTVDPLLRELTEWDAVSVIRHAQNAGIARGLNDGLISALDRNATWLLTVDQDTELPADYIPQFWAWLKDRQPLAPNVGVVGAAQVREGRGLIRYPLVGVEGLDTTPEVIQTGSLWKVQALQEIGGFDERFGIDGVDAAACVRLREAGYAVVVASGLSLRHSIGSTRTFRVLGRDIMVTGHLPDRRSTMLRNRLRLFPEEFRQSPRHAFRSLRRVLVNQSMGLILENDRREKTLGTLRGFRRDRPDTLES